MQKIGDIVGSTQNAVAKFKNDDTDKYISREFQKYAYELAKELDDLAHKSLYMRLAKTTSRGLLESARGFVKDALNVESKGRLFMWKLGELKKIKK
ncbi:MAG TPA: hypothetical protein VI795_02665 [Patescibacteria group bacterium]|nr:hypothetical protein [Patescibacteria group bacterium]